MRLITVTITDKGSDTHITDVFSNQMEAVNHFLKLAELNKAKWRKQVFRIDPDLTELMFAFNQKKYISLKAYDIR